MHYMRMRRHRGVARIKEDEGTLTLQVKVNGVDNQQAKAVKDLKQLSGRCSWSNRIMGCAHISKLLGHT